MQRNSNDVVTIKLYGTEIGSFVRRFFAVLFAIMFILLFLFLILGMDAAIGIVGFFIVVLLGIYFGAVTNQYSFFVTSGFLIIENEFLFFNNERFRIRIDEIEKLNFRFDNSEKNGTTHISIYSKSNKMKKFKIISSLIETEPILKTFKELHIPLSFSNIQTTEQRQFALKWLTDETF
jgi:hypothetical protein